MLSKKPFANYAIQRWKPNQLVFLQEQQGTVFWLQQLFDLKLLSEIAVNSSAQLQSTFRGTTNSGQNICFINSVLQCISNVPEVQDYFCSNKHLKYFVKVDPRKSMLNQLAKIVLAMKKWRKNPVDTKSFANVYFDKQTSQLPGEQGDVDSFFRILIELIEKEINKKPTSDELTFNQLPEFSNQQIHSKFMQFYKTKRNQPMFQRILSGYRCYIRECKNHKCMHTSGTFERFDQLTLSIKQSKVALDLVQIINNSQNKQHLQNFCCPKCNTKSSIENNMFAYCARLLVIVLKRYQYYSKKVNGKDVEQIRKIRTEINIPLKLRFDSNNIRSLSNYTYNLNSVITHSGSLASQGHYDAYKYTILKGKSCFVKYDDELVEIVLKGLKEKVLSSQDSYMMFYT